MNDQQIEHIIRDYIPQIVHMSLATSANDRPWVCEVHFAFDDGLNLYFVSSLESRHAKEIAQNSQVAGNIVTQHFKNQKVRGVYFEGIANVEEVDATHPGFVAYTDRFEQSGSLLDEIKKDGKAGLFKISVENFYLFDSYGESRGKHQLAWHKEETA